LEVIRKLFGQKKLSSERANCSDTLQIVFPFLNQ